MGEYSVISNREVVSVSGLYIYLSGGKERRKNKWFL